MALEAKAKAVRRKLEEIGPGGTLRLVVRSTLDRLLRREMWLYYVDVTRYALDPDSLSPGATSKVVEVETGLGPAEVRALRDYGGEEYCRTFEARLGDGWTLFLGYMGGALAGGAWAVTVRTSWRNASVPLLPTDVVVVDAFTLPRWRGHGVFPFLLSVIVREFESRGFRRAFGQVNEWNSPSARAFEKAGFMRALAHDVHELRLGEIPAGERLLVHGPTSLAVGTEENSGTRRLRVLHLASGDGWGGAERSLALLVEGTAARPFVEVEALLLNEGRLAATLRGLGVPVHLVPEGNRSFPRLCLETRRIVCHRRIDVVHAHRYKEILLAVIAARLGGRGLVATVHGLEPASQMGPRRALLLWSVALLARLSGTYLVAVSREIETRLRQRLGGTRILRIGNPMTETAAPDGSANDLRAGFGWPGDRPVVGFVGRLEEVKGPDLFLDLAAAYAGDAGFVLIGGGSMEEMLRERVERERLADRVRLIGQVHNAEVLLRQLDVLTVPSRHEGLPMVVLEAAAGHVPVVAFDVGGLAELLDGGFAAQRISPGDGRGLLKAVNELLADRDLARRDAARWAESLRARFSLPGIVESYVNVYRMAALRR